MEMATHSSIAVWRILWTEEPGGLLSMGWHRVGHDWSNLACMHELKKEMATHSSILAWRIPGTEEPCGLPSTGLHRVRHDWRDSAAAAARDQGQALCLFIDLLIHSLFQQKFHTYSPFRYELNQIPYDYTVEVRNRFKGLDLIERVPDEPWTEVHDIGQETGSKIIPKEKKCKKSKMAVWGGLTNRCEKKRSEKQRRKGYTYLNAEIQRIARRDKKAFLSK